MQTDLVLIDWLSITSKIHTKEQIVALLGMESASWTVTKGAHGYKDRLYYNCISIHYNGSPDQGVWLDMSGQGCRCFETVGHGDFDMLLQLVQDNPEQMKVTRMDVAYDDHSGILDLPQLCQDTRLQNYVAKATAWQVVESNKGAAVYIGSQQSEVLIRIYDKAAERNITDGTHWVRVEMQLRRDRALEFSKLPGTIGERYAGVLVNYLRYVEPDLHDSNKRRWALTDYWATLIGSAAAISIYTKPGLEYNVLRCENYVYKQAGNAIDALIKCYGQDKFFDKLQKRSARPNPKYSHMVEDFLRGCTVDG